MIFPGLLSSFDMQRRTIKQEIELSGIGIHSGKPSKVKFIPASPGIGIEFIRADLLEKPTIKALSENVSGTKRGTTLSKDNFSVSVVEHILAALHALGISDIHIEVDGPEPPVMDGSALPTFIALKKAGLKDFKESNPVLKVSKEIEIKDKQGKIIARPYNGFKISFMIDFPGTPIGKQVFSFDFEKDSFEKEIAPARTFGFIEEIEELKRTGLALGASTDNALAISKSGYMNKPRFKDEAVRHKILDLIGDLGLIGRSINAEIIAERSNHSLNTSLAAKLLK